MFRVRDPIPLGLIVESIPHTTVWGIFVSENKSLDYMSSQNALLSDSCTGDIGTI